QQKRNFPGDAIANTSQTAGYSFGSFDPTAAHPITVSAPGAGCPANGTLPNSFTLGQDIFCRFGGNLALAQTAADSGIGFFNSLLGLNPRTGDQLIFFPKVDIKIGGGNWATSYNWLNWTSPFGIQTQPTNTIAKDQFGDDLVRSRAFNSTYNRPLGGQSALEMRFHWSTETLSGDFDDPL